MATSNKEALRQFAERAAQNLPDDIRTTLSVGIAGSVCYAEDGKPLIALFCIPGPLVDAAVAFLASLAGSNTVLCSTPVPVGGPKPENN